MAGSFLPATFLFGPIPLPFCGPGSTLLDVFRNVHQHFGKRGKAILDSLLAISPLVFVSFFVVNGKGQYSRWRVVPLRNAMKMLAPFHLPFFSGSRLML